MTALSTNLPRSPGSVGAARRLVNGHIPSLDFQQREDAALMVSELVTNAVLHGVGAISLRIDLEGDMVRIEVADEGNVAVAPSPEPGAHGGRGLRIVEHLSDDWGLLDGSTRVWFRLGPAAPAAFKPRLAHRRRSTRPVVYLSPPRALITLAKAPLTGLRRPGSRSAGFLDVAGGHARLSFR